MLSLSKSTECPEPGPSLRPGEESPKPGNHCIYIYIHLYIREYIYIYVKYIYICIFCKMLNYWCSKDSIWISYFPDQLWQDCQRTLRLVCCAAKDAVHAPKTAALPLKALCLSHNTQGNCYEEIPGLVIAVASRKSTDLNMKLWGKKKALPISRNASKKWSEKGNKSSCIRSWHVAFPVHPAIAKRWRSGTVAPGGKWPSSPVRHY